MIIYLFSYINIYITSRDVQEELNVRTTLYNKEAVKDSEVIIVAVKPHIVAHVLDEVSSVVSKDQIIISLAAGTKLETMAEVDILYNQEIVISGIPRIYQMVHKWLGPCQTPLAV